MKHYDYDMKSFPDFMKAGRLRKIFSEKDQYASTKKTLKRAYVKYYNTWDYQLAFAIWNKGGLCINPNVNLVSNIGFDLRGTHTHTIDTRCANIPVAPIGFPLRHPSVMKADAEADYFTFRNILYVPFFTRFRLQLGKMMRKAGWKK